MKQELQVLKRTELLGQQFKVYGTKEEPLFLAKDVAKLLEVSNVSQLAKDVDEDEKGLYLIYTPGGIQNMLFLTEDGLYESLMMSRKPIAKEFKKGVKKILHEIRLNGEYVSPKKSASKSKVEAHYTAIKMKKELLNLNDSSVALLINNTDTALGIEGQYIDYVPSKGVLSSATELLKKNGIKMSAQAFNKKLLEKGVLEVHTRRKKDGSDKTFYAIADNWLTYGENEVNPKNQNEVQPKWYINSFMNLYNTL